MKRHPPTFWMVFSLLLFSSQLMATQVIAEDCNAVRAKYQCPAKKHKLHLSFDDGVGSVTAKVLDILKRENIKATFFVLGNKIDCTQYKAGESLDLCKQRFKVLQRIKREGHDIGSHGYQHYHHSQLAPAELKRTLNHSRKVLEPFLTTEPAIFRLPYGDGWFNRQDKPFVMQALKELNFEHIAWEMTAYDWNEKFQQGDKILDNVMTQMCHGRGRDGVVLFHDGVHENEHEGRLFTADNLARWIPKLRCAADFIPLLDYKKNLKKKKQ